MRATPCNSRLSQFARMPLSFYLLGKLMKDFTEPMFHNKFRLTNTHEIASQLVDRYPHIHSFKAIALLSCLKKIQLYRSTLTLRKRNSRVSPGFELAAQQRNVTSNKKHFQLKSRALTTRPNCEP